MEEVDDDDDNDVNSDDEIDEWYVLHGFLFYIDPACLSHLSKIAKTGGYMIC